MTRPTISIFACYPVAGCPPGYPNKHFPKKECEQCGALMYVGPNITAARKEQPSIPLLCMPCAIRVSMERDGRKPPVDERGYVKTDGLVWDTPEGVVVEPRA